MDIHKIRWPLSECPIPVKFKEQKPVIHPIIENFYELPEEQKNVLLKIKKIINFYLPDAKLFLFGSRTKGNWDETSDYDIMVETKENGEKNKILKKYDFGVKVDICFTQKYEAIKKIEIA